MGNNNNRNTGYATADSYFPFFFKFFLSKGKMILAPTLCFIALIPVMQGDAAVDGFSGILADEKPTARSDAELGPDELYTHIVYKPTEDHVVRTCDPDVLVRPRLDGLIADRATGGSKMFAA